MSSHTANPADLSRRTLLRTGAAGALAAGAAAAGLSAPAAAAPTAQAGSLPPAIQAIMAAPKYRAARWFVYFADRATGTPIYNMNGGDLVLPASTTKLWSTAAALDAYGPNFRFETPIYKSGALDAAGNLSGNLILVASGDLTMGGRDTKDGKIDFAPLDHAEANIIPGAALTPEDPLAGLNDLARQVAAAGVRRVAGQVLIDARLFEQYPKDDYILTPIMVNDNLIDLIVRPGAAGGAATVDWRPRTATYQLQANVSTVAAGGTLDVTATESSLGVITVTGTVPADAGEVIRTVQVENPQAFARTLLIEALVRAGVAVDAPATGPNPVDRLPAQGSYAAADRVALHTSLPFSENIKLINKVSMNVQADTLICLLAVKAGENTFEDGMPQLLPFIRKAGIDDNLISLSDGRGNEYTDLFSPRTVTEMLRYMTTRPDFPAYFNSLPIFGVDGTELITVDPTSPVAGKAQAKSGTTVAGDLMHQRLILMTRGNTGFLTTKSGRELVFGLYVMHVPLPGAIDDLFPLIKDLGAIVEVAYDLN